MLFGVRLASEVYPPWKQSYIDYDGLKELLKEDGKSWSESDESRFTEALDKELEKVYSFQMKTYHEIMDRLNALEKSTNTEEGLQNLDTEQLQSGMEVPLT